MNITIGQSNNNTYTEYVLEDNQRHRLELVRTVEDGRALIARWIMYDTLWNGQEAVPSIVDQFYSVYAVSQDPACPPSIARYVGLATYADSLCVLSEYVEGPTVKAALNSRDVRNAPGTIAGLAQGLSHMYLYGVSHNEVSPLNVVMHETRGAVFVNWGLSALSDAQERAGIVHPKKHVFMDPNVFSTGNYAGVASDVYGLAVVAYCLLHHRVPSTRRFTIDETLAGPNANLLKRALQRDPNARPCLDEMRAMNV